MSSDIRQSGCFTVRLKHQIKKYGADALYSTVKSLMHAIWTEDDEVQQEVGH